MANKDFKVKNKLIINGVSSAGPLTIDASGNVDSTSFIPTQYGGTGTTTSPTSGQILYSSAGTSYAPTDLSSLTISTNGGSTITAATSSTIPLTLKGAASQSANLQEWQNSSGTVLAKIASNGTATFNGILIGQTASSASATNISIGSSDTGASLTSTATSNVLIGAAAGSSITSTTDNTMVGHRTGTYNYGQYNTFVGSSNGFYNGGGGGNNNTYIGTFVGYSGAGSSNVMIGYSAGQNTPGSNQLVIANSNTATPLIGGDFSAKTLTISGNAAINSQTAATIGLIVKGATSQSANLQEWQNSSGTVLASISPTGTISTKPVPFSGNLNAAIISVTDTGSTWGAGTFSFRSDGAGTPRFSFTAPNAATEALIIVNNNVGVRTVAPNSTFHVSTGAAANIGAIVQGAVSQSADLMQLQNNTGYVYVKFDNYGNATFNGAANVFNAGGASYVPVTIKGASSQTANLQEWQNSAGTVIAKVNSAGNIYSDAFITNYSGYISSYYYVGQNNGAVYLDWTGNAPKIINQANVANTVLTIKGMTSQTGDLQQWQNSSGTVLASFASDGKLNLNTSGTGYINLGDGQLYKGPGNGFIFNSDLVTINGKGVYSSLAYINNVTSTSTVPLTVKGIASQSANLQEWQNSSGTVLASISAAGNLTVQDLTVNGTTTTINSTTLTVDDKNIELASVNSPTDTTADGAGITIKGATDKTFNWVQSTGAFTSSEPISTPALSVSGNSVSSNITLAAGKRYFVDTTSARTLTLPASPSLGDEIQIFDANGTAATYNITINSNSGKINGTVQDLLVDTNGAALSLIYTGSTYGWVVR